MIHYEIIYKDLCFEDRKIFDKLYKSRLNRRYNGMKGKSFFFKFDNKGQRDDFIHTIAPKIHETTNKDYQFFEDYCIIKNPK